jgi:hypothetical protein
MFDFLKDLPAFQQAYWIIAIVGSAIFVVIFILTFLGGDSDADMEADAGDFDADDGGVGFQFFTFKNVIAFFTIFGWSGVSCIENQLSTTTTLIISTIAGLIMMVITGHLLVATQRLPIQQVMLVKVTTRLILVFHEQCKLAVEFGLKMTMTAMPLHTMF